MSIQRLYSLYQENPSVQIDSRKLKPGDIFFALKGGNFNGNTFAKQALDAGASHVVIDEKEYEIPGKTYLADDVLKTLQLLAKFHREQFNILPEGRQVPFIAVTGSNGKTTTKELIHAVLSSSFITYTTEGNLNNHIGIPLTILKIRNDAQMAIIEMGANHQKEIEAYCEYAQPTHGLITNAGKAHLEGFGGIEGVRKGKGELYDYLRIHNGTAFVMWDYGYLREMSKGISGIIKYGTTDDAHVIGNALKSDPFLEVEIKQGLDQPVITTQLVGSYNLPNVLAAVTIGKFFKVPEEAIRNAIQNYAPTNSRSQLLQKNSNYIILDAYNANPSSMKLAIENFARLEGGEKVLMLGGMAELGQESLEEHRAIVELIKQTDWKAVVLVGGDFLKTSHPYVQFENAQQAAEWLKQQHFKHTHLLIKGSRSMQMEKVLE
jgi:UDP-N-acetylmuramoyl-tripeptide--D-alanyl-D-alanine ligase